MSMAFWKNKKTHEAIGRCSIALAPEDNPTFKRSYRIDLEGGFRVEVVIKNFYSSGTYVTSTLTQPNGKWILFDARSVADKIIDRDLSPSVQSAVDEILLIDKEFRSNPPVQFIDKSGHTWRR